MREFVMALGWELAMLLAFMGWGASLLRLLRIREGWRAFAAADWLEALAAGLVVSALAGGVLNLLGWAGGPGAVTFVLVGAACGFVALGSLARRLRDFRHGLAADRLAAGLAGAIIFLLVLHLCGSVIVPSYDPNSQWKGVQFNPHDDMHSYLVSVERLLQTGTLGEDPFNSRQMANALGGQDFLNLLTVAAVPLDHIHMLEHGLGIVVLCLAAGGLGLRLGAGIRGAAAVMLVPLVVHWPVVNISSVVTSAAALVFLVSALQQLSAATLSSEPTWRHIMIAGIALGGACALKSTTLPVACLVVAILSIAGALIFRRPRMLRDGAVIGGIAALCILPWMLWQHHSSGTLLYPILGKGDYIDAYYRWPSPHLPLGDKLASGLGVLVPVVLLACLAWALRSSDFRKRVGTLCGLVLVAFLLAWIVDWVILLEVTEMPDCGRYVTSAATSGVILFLAVLWRTGKPMWIGVFTAAAVVWYSPQWLEVYTTQIPAGLEASLSAPMRDWEGEARDLRNMQEVIPQGAKMVAYLTTPALLDFRRNQVYVMDWPGESSPPPGLPIWADAQAMADYLLAQHIRYVCYSYRLQANFPRSIYQADLAPSFGKIMSRQAAESFKFQDALVAWCRQRRIIYHDAENLVLDLGTRQGEQSSP